MEPLSAIATASAAFTAIKKGFQFGKDIESMAGDLSRWMGALSDLDQAEKEAKNPPIFKKMFAGKSIEQEAMEVFAAKRKAQAQRDELRQWISAVLGPSAWDDLVKTEAKIRKQRQETLYAQREKRRKFSEIVFWIVFAVFGCVLIGGFILFLLSIKPARASTLHPEYTVCRLVDCQKHEGDYLCLYTGANNTQDIAIYERGENIQRTIQCKYLPNDTKPPTIEETLDSIKDAMQ
jgi:hypothetical protein